MAMIDDWEALYKLHGIVSVTALIEHAGVELLKRTGLDLLLYQVSHTCPTNL